MNQRKHGVVPEPLGLFLFQNGLVAVLLLAFAYQMGSYRGLPNVLIIISSPW